jgi:hypothetical protein
MFSKVGLSTHFGTPLSAKASRDNDSAYKFSGRFPHQRSLSLEPRPAYKPEPVSFGNCKLFTTNVGRENGTSRRMTRKGHGVCLLASASRKFATFELGKPITPPATIAVADWSSANSSQRHDEQEHQY